MREKTFDKQKVLMLLQEKFNPKEAEILKMRWGIGYPNPMTTSDMAKQMNTDIDELRLRLRTLGKQVLDMLKEEKST